MLCNFRTNKDPNITIQKMPKKDTQKVILNLVFRAMLKVTSGLISSSR